MLCLMYLTIELILMFPEFAVAMFAGMFFL